MTVFKKIPRLQNSWVLLFLLWGHSLNATTKAPVFLIDPGHGGDDCGARSVIKARGGEVCEKDLALEIATRVHKILRKKYDAYLTRSIDRNISLDERAQMADKVAADYFVSIHLNSHEKPHAKGLEVYFLDNHDNIAVHKIERVENKDQKGEIVVINQILADLVIERTAPISRLMAKYVHQGIVSHVKKPFGYTDRGPKAALFYVLALSKRPSILIEAGFISHPEERELLVREKFQEKFAEGIVEGLEKFLEKRPKE